MIRNMEHVASPYDQTKLEDALADELLSGNVHRGDTVTVRVKKDEIVFEH